MTETPERLAERLNLETGRLDWSELQPHFARGIVVRVSSDLDLIEAAVAVARDDKDRIEGWMSRDRLRSAADTDARRWENARQEFWAVVVAPWVIVQEATD